MCPDSSKTSALYKSFTYLLNVVFLHTATVTRGKAWFPKIHWQHCTSRELLNMLIMLSLRTVFCAVILANPLTLSAVSIRAKNVLKIISFSYWFSFLLRCMECSRGIAMRILSVRSSIRPSVCLSVKRVHCDKTEESYV